jgi:hypothetical protein
MDEVFPVYDRTQTPTLIVSNRTERTAQQYTQQQLPKFLTGTAQQRHSTDRSDINRLQIIIILLVKVCNQRSVSKNDAENDKELTRTQHCIQKVRMEFSTKIILRKTLWILH